MQRASLIRALALASLGALLGATPPPAAPARANQEGSGRQVYPEMPAGRPPSLPVEGAQAEEEAQMRPYREVLPGAEAGFELIPIHAGSFSMGSPESEAERAADEGPLHEVHLEPFWMGKTEVTWDVYQEFQFQLDRKRRSEGEAQAGPQDAWADAVSRPTPPYVPMNFGMGIEGHPAICMTQLAAKQFTKWLSMKTGRFYRLPTEAEWEYACRAGTTTAYSFGDDPEQLDEFAWYFDNADDSYRPVATKKPNPWGLYDMHGNVAEWVLDAHADYGAQAVSDPLHWPTQEYGRIVRGGSWDDDPEWLRSAARRESRAGWKVQDPQLPKSIWYHTDARFVGFRIVRPLKEPAPTEWARYWEADLDSVREILERQRQGER